MNTFRHLKVYSKNDVLYLTKIRRFETKLGERIQVLTDAADVEKSIAGTDAKYVLFGIPEDLGVKGNYGNGGADSLWIPFLQSFFNMQSNDFFDGGEILLIGHFDFGDIEYLIDHTAKSDEEKLEAYRHAVNTIDEEVEHLAKIITENKKIPVVVGGGHNNSYPLIKGTAKGWFKAGVIPLAQINCTNLDAHADYRPMEGRHSGNSFRYAEEDGYLSKYCVIGLHENYIPQNVWIDIVNNPFFDCITFEDIFVHEKRTFMQAVAHAVSFTDESLTGIDIDLDGIQNTLSSAMTPVGFSSVNARQFVSYAAAFTKPAYLHICEGATRLSDGRTDLTSGKLISYLVSDFVKGMAEG
ncbi:MAG: arginase family protein [Chitinophagaceae bacterium]|nr:arginase family protein [Chitinophagaceae bacterium]